jgi:hypothetical protein
VLPSHIVRIAWLVVVHDRPRQMQQFPGHSTSGALRWLPSPAQTRLEGLDDGVMLHST